MGAQTIRVPITVKLFTVENHELIWSSSSAVKSKIRNLTSEALAQNEGNDVYGECVVMYSRKQDSWNGFVFSTMEEFDEKITPILELGLLRELKSAGMLEKGYLG